MEYSGAALAGEDGTYTLRIAITREPNPAAEAAWAAAGAPCVCCGHVFTEASPPAAIAVTAVYQHDEANMFHARICASCADCGDQELIDKARGVVTEIYPDRELIMLSEMTMVGHRGRWATETSAVTPKVYPDEELTGIANQPCDAGDVTDLARRRGGALT
jgi:hypothetical protein